MIEELALDLTKNVFIHTIFFLTLPDTPGEDQGKDWLAFVIKDKNGWQARYRFRYYHEKEAFGSKDEKNWYQFNNIHTAEDAEHIVQAFRRVAQGMLGLANKNSPDFECYFNELSVMGNGEEAMELLSKQPWAHMKFTNCKGETPQA